MRLHTAYELYRLSKAAYNGIYVLGYKIGQKTRKK